MSHIAWGTQILIFYNLSTQSVVHGPAAEASSEWLSDMQNSQAAAQAS